MDQIGKILVEDVFSFKIAEDLSPKSCLFEHYTSSSDRDMNNACSAAKKSVN